MKLNVEIEIDADRAVVWNEFTDLANMSRWVQNLEVVDEDQTCCTSSCRLMFTGFMRLMSLFTGDTIHE